MSKSSSTCAPSRLERDKFSFKAHPTVLPWSLAFSSWSVWVAMSCTSAQGGETKVVSSLPGTDGTLAKISSICSILTADFLSKWMSRNWWSRWSREICSNNKETIWDENLKRRPPTLRRNRSSTRQKVMHFSILSNLPSRRLNTASTLDRDNNRMLCCYLRFVLLQLKMPY